MKKMIFEKKYFEKGIFEMRLALRQYGEFAPVLGISEEFDYELEAGSPKEQKVLRKESKGREL